MIAASVSLSNFVDFVLTVGTGRIELAKAIQARKEPDDFYKSLRASIADMHGAPEDYGNVLNEILLAGHTLTDRERRVFPKVVKGYQKFLRGAGPVTWFEPPLRDYPIAPGPFCVTVAADLGLLLDGKPHAIRLYFRGDPLPAARALATTELMAMALGPTWPGTAFSVLDVRRAKLWSHRPKPGVQAWLRGEAACLAAMVNATLTRTD